MCDENVFGKGVVRYDACCVSERVAGDIHRHMCIDDRVTVMPRLAANRNTESIMNSKSFDTQALAMMLDPTAAVFARRHSQSVLYACRGVLLSLSLSLSVCVSLCILSHLLV